MSIAVKQYRMEHAKIICTGSPGSGKTIIIGLLEAYGITCLPEIPRLIIEQQSNIENGILPQSNFPEFAQLVLQQMLTQYKQTSNRLIIYDRGIPDIVAYFKSQGKIAPQNIQQHAHNTSYYPKVFMFPPWKEIYKKDGARYESYKDALAIHKALVDVYKSLGYSIIVVPKVDKQDRLEFVLNHLKADKLIE